MNDVDPVANLARMQVLAGYDLFDPDLAADLRVLCRRSAEAIGIPLTAVQVVLNTATAVLATNGPEADFLTPLGGTPNEYSLCLNVVVDRAPYVVDDLTEHPTCADNPAVRAGMMRAYAGVPLTLPDGEIIGSHCAAGPQPRHFTESDMAVLAGAAEEIVARITRDRPADVS